MALAGGAQRGTARRGAGARIRRGASVPAQADSVIFGKPDHETTRISDCGRFVIVRHSTPTGPAYALWHYELAQTGFGSAAEAQGAAQRIWDGYTAMGELPGLGEA